MHKLVWCIIPCGPKKTHPAFIVEVSPCNIGVSFGISLLPSCYNKDNLTIGTFRHLGKADLMFNLVNRLTFEFFCAILHCSVAAGTCLGLGIHAVGWISHCKMQQAMKKVQIVLT